MSDWRTIDEYLPMLKYGTELPAASPSSSVFTTSPPALPGTNVAITDVNVPFSSVMRMTKIFAAWLIVIACFVPVIMVLWFIVFAIIGAFVGHSISLPHKP